MTITSPAADRPVVVTLMGPTASGKTDAALALASRADIDIISVDSAMVYRGMDIGTAKPDRTVLERFPHRLVDICDPTEVYSAQRFVEDADAAVRTAWAHHRIPLLVGGTMLYFRAFKAGLSNLPPADARIRREIDDEARDRGWEALHADLAQVDPEAASGIDPHNRQRLQRALEVYRATGRPISSFWRDDDKKTAPERLGCRLVEFALTDIPRTSLHERIAERLDVMFARGLVEEVRALCETWDLDRDTPAMRAVGYRQVVEFLHDEDSSSLESQESLRERVLFATRQLAKKQLTWLRRWSDLEPVVSAQAAPDAVLKKLEALAIVAG